MDLWLLKSYYFLVMYIYILFIYLYCHGDNPKYSNELQYKKDFEGNEDQSLLLSATGNLFAKDQVSDFTNTTKVGTADDLLQRA